MNEAIKMVSDRYEYVDVVDLNSVIDVTSDLVPGDYVHLAGGGQFKLGQLFLAGLANHKQQIIEASHIDRLGALLRSNEQSAGGDLDGSGEVEFADFQYLIETVVGTSFGDANLDGSFDFKDLMQVYQTSEYNDRVSMNSGWASGDWNGDAEFDASDLVLAFQNDAFVPEPTHDRSTWAWTLVALTWLQRKRHSLSFRGD
jgi:hypothetical protein